MGISTHPERRPLLVIGLGNELLADDGVGIHVVRHLKERLSRDDLAFEELSVGGLQLIDYLAGYERCILVDAVVTGASPAGTIHRFVQHAGGESLRLSSSHHVDLSEVLALGTMLGADLPETVLVYGIEAGDTTTFSETCTDQVRKAIPRLVDLICRDIQENKMGCKNKTVLATESTARDHRGNWEIINH
ncbi:MAG: hydrogenase maturation protease [Bacteroidota bacterium]